MKNEMQEKKEEFCQWVFVIDDDVDYWQTECDESFKFTHKDGIKDNNFNFCPTCGKRIET